jgi:hypothetical protein
MFDEHREIRLLHTPRCSATFSRSLAHSGFVYRLNVRALKNALADICAPADGSPGYSTL